MQLNSVENDLVKVLNYLRYRHDDRKTVWRILIDFDLKYKDRNGKTKLLKRINPTKDAILDALVEAGGTGRSGLVYFGGHGEYGPRGTSVLTPSGERTQYSVMVDAQADSQVNSSFLLAIDGGRISGEDIISRLPEEVSGECIHMVALDACHSAGIANAARNLLHVYEGKKIQNDEHPEEQGDVANPEEGTSKQLVIISAAKEGELARTVRAHKGSTREFGKLTWYMLHWLKKFPHAEAQNLSERLEHTCVNLAKKGEAQHPQIFARRPVEGPFEILPGLSHHYLKESSAVDIPERAFLGLHWFRPLCRVPLGQHIEPHASGPLLTSYYLNTCICKVNVHPTMGHSYSLSGRTRMS